MIELIASTPIARIVVLILLFAIIAATAMLVLAGLSRRAAIKEELTTIAAATGGQSRESLRSRRTDAWTRLANQIEKMGLNLTDTRDHILRAKMVSAGFESAAAPRIYTLVRLLLVILLPSLFVLATLGMGKQLSFGKLYLYGSLSAVAGLYLPALYLRSRTDQRQTAMVKGFPDCLDLMLVCVEAGLGLEAALDRVSHEMVLAHPLVARLLTTTTLRLRAGATREDALRRMADDAEVDEIRSFATLLIQSDKLGTSIATTLRIYAAEMREKRRMRAEEKAHRLPVLISIPLVACMLPVMIGVLMLPAAIRVVRTLLPALTGG